MLKKEGKNARKKRLRRQVAIFDRWQLDGRRPTFNGCSKRQAQAHGDSCNFVRRQSWKGAGLRDGCQHATRTFIKVGKLEVRPVFSFSYQREDKVK